MLVLRGELDVRTASFADKASADAERSHELVALDLRHLSFMDSGLGNWLDVRSDPSDLFASR